MGQAQSNDNSASSTTPTSNTPPPSTNPPRDSDGDDTSMGSLLAGSAFYISIEMNVYILAEKSIIFVNCFSLCF